MKKILLIALILLGFTTATMAQNATTDAATATVEEVTLQSISTKLDGFIDSQNTINKQLTNNVNNLYQNRNTNMNMIFNNLIPIFILIVIGGFFIFLTYILTTNNYRNNQSRYDTMLKCVESTGSVPDYFTKMARNKSVAVPAAGRVPLILSIICIITGTIFLIATISIIDNHSYGQFKIGSILSGITGVVFVISSVLLFIQYSRISESSRKEQ